MRFIAGFLIGLYAGPFSAVADEAAWAALREGGRVALIRHADAPGGSGDPENFRLDDCATQRNLSEKGREQARMLGERLRAQKVAVGKILTSQWCRCRETASLMALGDVSDAPAFNNAYVLADRRAELTREARAQIAAWKGPATLIVVTHGANILPLTGVHPAQAEIVVVEPQPAADGKLRVTGRITLD